MAQSSFDPTDSIDAAQGLCFDSSGAGATEALNAALKRPMAEGSGLSDTEGSVVDASSISDFVPDEESAGV